MVVLLVLFIQNIVSIVFFYELAIQLQTSTFFASPSSANQPAHSSQFPGQFFTRTWQFAVDRVTLWHFQVNRCIRNPPGQLKWKQVSVAASTFWFIFRILIQSQHSNTHVHMAYLYCDSVLVSDYLLIFFCY